MATAEEIIQDFRAAIVSPPLLPPNRRPELFLIPDTTMDSLSIQEVMATYNDMETLGLAHLPYPSVEIAIPADQRIVVTHRDDNGEIDLESKPFDGWNIRIRYADEIPTGAYLISPKNICFDLDALFRYQCITEINYEATDPDTILAVAAQLRKCLIVLLATRNAIKTRTKNKSLGMGIGAKHHPMRPLYTTTITVPTELPDHEAAETGPKRPHLRRGHIRNQRHGPAYSFTRAIWIEPTFVNCDESFISSRTAYNTSLTF